VTGVLSHGIGSPEISGGALRFFAKLAG